MSIDGWQSTVRAVAVRWAALERDWQSVVVGAVIVAIVAGLGLQVPW